MKTRSRVIVAGMVLLISSACGGGGKQETARAAAAPQQQEQARTACAMITAAEMSTIIGTPLASESEEGVGTTTCRYKPASSSSPYVEVKIDWGNGAVAMMATGLLSRLEPGISDRLAGIGDQASAAGPVLMIRTGEDLVNLTIWGVDDHVASAKRIINQMRPRMGPSAQSAESKASEDATSPERPRRAAAPPVADETFAPASGPSIRIPLVAGLTLVGAENEPQRGDYEPIVTIAAVEANMVSTVFSANLPEGTRLSVDRHVRRADLEQARGFRSWYEDGDPPVFDGTTSFSVSSAVFSDLKTKGQATVVRMNPDSDPLAALVSLVASGGEANTAQHRGILERVEPHAVAFPVLVNNAPAELPAIHARGTFDDATIDFHVLDDPDNPLILRVAGGSTGRIVRIAFPTPSAAPIEETLKKDARVELHGIYFDFGKDTIRPESEPVLSDIASALTHNPDWKINIEGHTDNIGGTDMNLDLSRRRAAAVKQALIDRYHVPAAGLTTAGFGDTKPNASNDTMSGRARNRRVELVRQ